MLLIELLHSIVLLQTTKVLNNTWHLCASRIVCHEEGSVLIRDSMGLKISYTLLLMMMRITLRIK